MNKLESKNILIELDKEFCKSSIRLGADAWMMYLDEHAVIITGGHRDNLIGKENIYNSLKQLYALENISFVWEPQLSDISDDLSLGYTTGVYTRTYKYKNKNYKEIGKYTTVWKKVAGKWKISLDVGNEEKVEMK
ncbi:nuclear transport factor 2 family protein [Mycoplasmatota bacterium WC30]